MDHQREGSMNANWKYDPWTPLNLDDIEVERYPEDRRVNWAVVTMVVLALWTVAATILAVL